MNTPVAQSSACWIPLNDPQGRHHFQQIGDYVITRMTWSNRPTTFIVSRPEIGDVVLKTDDYADVLAIIWGQS